MNDGCVDCCREIAKHRPYLLNPPYAPPMSNPRKPEHQGEPHAEAAPSRTAAEAQAGLNALRSLLNSGEHRECAHVIQAMDPRDQVHAVAQLEEDDRAKLFALLDPDDAAALLAQLPEALAVDAVEDLSPVAAARILSELPSDEQADLIGELHHSDADAIIRHLSADDAKDVRRLVKYKDDVAGGLMVTEYLAYPDSATIAEVIEDLGNNAGRYANYDIQYAYVIESGGRLVGVMRMRDLLLSHRSRVLREIMIPAPLSVRDQDSLEYLVRFFDEHRFFGVPVVDGSGVLCGVVKQSAVEAAVAEHSEELYRHTQGIFGGEELRSLPLFLRARRRLSWLSINIALNILAASIIAVHQDTLEAVIALAVFLPIISDMSGCSGNQSVAVSMRELTLGVATPSDLRRTVVAEVSLGMINGLVLGILLGLVAWAWKGNIYLGIVVGGALMLNTVVSVVVGGSVPLMLKRFGLDPAIGAGPILTTVTDMCGFFIVLTFAAAMLSKLAM